MSTEQSDQSTPMELIAFDQWIESDQSILQGTISIGNIWIWQFGQLGWEANCITQDFDRVSADLESRLRISVHILQPAI
jgi:hypothetical protein